MEPHLPQLSNLSPNNRWYLHIGRFFPGSVDPTLYKCLPPKNGYHVVDGAITFLALRWIFYLQKRNIYSILFFGFLWLVSQRKKHQKKMSQNMAVSENRATPKSSIFIGFSIINHPFWGTPICGNTHIPNIKKITPSPSVPCLYHWTLRRFQAMVDPCLFLWAMLVWYQGLSLGKWLQVCGKTWGTNTIQNDYTMFVKNR